MRSIAISKHNKHTMSDRPKQASPASVDRRYEALSLSVRIVQSFRIKNLLFVPLLLVTCVSDGSEFYQWKDKAGNTLYSDQPPKAGAAVAENLDVAASQKNNLFNQIKNEAGKRLLKSVANGDYYQYVPDNIDRAFVIVVVNHGMFSSNESASKAAYNTSRRWQRFSAETGAIIIAPVFDNHRYAVTTEGPQRWGYRGLFGRHVGADIFLNEIISYYQSANRFYDGKIFLSGHSAGAQFANRYLVRHPDKVHAAAFSAPAWFALPSDRFTWPNGMNNRYRVVRWPGSTVDQVVDVRPKPDGWLKAAQLPVTVVVGQNDIARIRHVDGIGGDTHVERARFWVQSMNEYALQHGVEGKVRLNVVHFVGHNFGKLAAVCQDSLKIEIENQLFKEQQKVSKYSNSKLPNTNVSVD